MKKLSVVGISTIVTALLTGALAPGVSPVQAAGAKPYAGQTIIVDWAPPSPALSAKFTAETGIKVKWVDIGWDAEQQLIATSAAAHTYFADVTDVDWSKVGEYYDTKWFVPLNQYFNIPQLKKDAPQLNEFMVNGQLIGVPVDASFMTTTINTADFEKAGIKTPPKTFAKYNADLKLLQRKHVSAHPLGIPLAAAEGLSTYWYETTAAMGGRLFGPGNKPLFTSPNSPGYKAMEWMVNAYKSGLVPKAMINTTDSEEMQSDMAHNRIATIFSDYSGNVAGIYNDPKQDPHPGQVKYIPTPSVKGEVNLGNPDGLGIPQTAKHVGAAAVFLNWFTSSKVQAELAGLGGYKVVVGMPMRISSMKMLAKEDKNPKDEWNTLIRLFKNVQPIFPQGGPPWYAQFSNAVYTNLHAAALGTESVAQAIQAIANTVNELNQG
ncbi:MAG: extracellular solute-binding protein [Alicyclobacillus sp.]|nr:extracellular solute-binding protein [Alicyclobacillus sp.]